MLSEAVAMPFLRLLSAKISLPLELENQLCRSLRTVACWWSLPGTLRVLIYARGTTVLASRHVCSAMRQMFPGSWWSVVVAGS